MNNKRYELVRSEMDPLTVDQLKEMEAVHKEMEEHFQRYSKLRSLYQEALALEEDTDRQQLIRRCINGLDEDNK